MDSRIKNNNHDKFIIYFRDPKSFFECYVEYVRPQNGEDPQMKKLYPKDYQFDEDLKRNLPKFVFPTNDSNTNSEEHFAFCLTDLEGKFRFGFCRYPARGDLCSCFLSDLPWFKVFYRMLDKLSEMHLDYQAELIDPFLASLYKHPIPSLTNETIISIIPEGVDTGQVYTFPLPNPKRLPEIPTDHNLTLFYPCLHHQIVLCLFANMLFERRIIITSSSLKILSAAVHGSALLLYPLFWQHIFIPITPPHLIDYCTAPMPFLMGIHSSMMEQVRQMPINDAVILDVDKSELESPYYEDLLQLPPNISLQLKSAIKKSTSAYGDTAARAFLQANVALLGGYRSALKMREGESEVTFDEEAFFKSRPPEMEEFLKNLLQFQHFQQFLFSRIERLNRNQERDIFDEEVISYDDDLKSSKYSSDQMKLAFKDMKKHSTKAAKNTRTLMKDIFKNEKIGPGDYYALSTYNSVNKSATIDGRPRGREPPPVIPYQKHKEGMDRLNQSLQEQKKRMSLVGMQPLLLVTPTDGIQKINIDDAAESASLSSKESMEVLTDQLIDIGDDTDRVPTPLVFRPLSDEGDTDSASIISSSSTSSGSMSGLQWGGETIKNDNALDTPPVPPPRKKRVNVVKQNDNIFSKATSLSKSRNEEYEMENRSSPIADFGLSIADTLIGNSRKFSDPLAATSLSDAGLELHKALQKDTSFTTVSSTQSLQCTTTSSNGGVISDIISDNSRSMPVILESADNRSDPWEPIPLQPEVGRNPFQPGGAPTNKPSPPIKPARPQPYSGTFFEKFLSSNQGNILTPMKVASANNIDSTQTAPKDPLDDIFGIDGLKGYATKSKS